MTWALACAQHFSGNIVRNRDANGVISPGLIFERLSAVRAHKFLENGRLLEKLKEHYLTQIKHVTLLPIEMRQQGCDATARLVLTPG